MIEEPAQVIEIDKDDHRYVWIEAKRQSSCGSCDAKSACGTQVLSKIIGKRSNRIRILNTCQAEAGDNIIIGIDEQSLLKGSIYLYLIPMVGMIVFSLLATILSNRLNLSSQLVDLNSFLFAALGFVAGGWYSRKKIISGFRDSGLLKAADLESAASNKDLPSQTIFQVSMIKVLPKPFNSPIFPISSLSNSQ
ncbi:MAG: SoxR reducing system RseC family protein [Pseudomonadota bacterium]